LRVAAPPAAPLAALVPTELPPAAVAATVAAGLPVAALSAVPPLPAVELARPPVPPVPPETAALVVLPVRPVWPEAALASEAAPELELLDERPELLAPPVVPLGAAVVGGVLWFDSSCPPEGGMVAGAAAGGMVDGEVWATAAPPQNTRMAAMSAPTEADTLEILEPGLLFMLIPCGWGPRRPCGCSQILRGN
jgi:hypothetical protein